RKVRPSRARIRRSRSLSSSSRGARGSAASGTAGMLRDYGGAAPRRPRRAAPSARVEDWSHGDLVACFPRRRLGSRPRPRRGPPPRARRLPARGGEGRARLPAGRGPGAACLHPPDVRGAGADRGPGPLPHPGPPDRALLRRGARCAPAAPLADQHLHRARERPRDPPRVARRPHRLAGPGRAAAEPRAHRLARCPGLAPMARLGGDHRACAARPGGPRRSAGGDPVGSRRAVADPAAGRGASRRQPAPEPAVRLPRLLRLPSVLPDRCPARTAGRGPDRLAHPGLSGPARRVHVPPDVSFSGVGERLGQEARACGASEDPSPERSPTARRRETAVAEPRSTIEEAGDPHTGPERLLELTEKHPQLHRLIVLNPSCPEVARQWILATNPWAKQAYEESLAGTPGAPEEPSEAPGEPDEAESEDPDAVSVWGDLGAAAASSDAAQEAPAQSAAPGVRLSENSRVVPLGATPPTASSPASAAPPAPAAPVYDDGAAAGGVDPDQADGARSRRRTWYACGGCLLLALLLVVVVALVGRAWLADDEEEYQRDSSTTSAEESPSEQPAEEPTEEETEEPVSPAPED